MRWSAAYRRDRCSDAVDLIRAQGIQTGMFLMWGYEGEQNRGYRGDRRARAGLRAGCVPDYGLVSDRRTPYYDRRRLPVWSASANGRQTTDRDCHIRGRHSRRYYQFADELLRAGTAKTWTRNSMAAARAGCRLPRARWKHDQSF